MIQKYIFTIVILLCPPLLLHAMKINKLGEIDTKLIKLYAKKMGTKKIIDQLRQCRPMEIIKPDPNDSRDIIHYKQFPCIHFATLFMKNITAPKDLYFWDGLIADQPLTAAVFTTIDTIESKDGYIPEHIVREGKDFVNVRMPNNWLDRHTRYWHKISQHQKPYVECNTTFFHEDKEAIEEALS